MPDNDLITGLARSATDYRRGLFCPAEPWGQVARRLGGHDVEALLGGLPPESRQVLRDAYRERPRSPRSESADGDVIRAIERWCCRPDA